MSERVPKGWVKGALGNVCSSIRGVSYKPEDLRNVRSTQTVTLLRSNNIQERGIDFQNVQYVDISKVKQKQMMCDRDIAVCMSNGSKRLVGKNATLYDPVSSETFTVGAFCSIVRAKEKSSYQFIRHLLKSNDFKQQVEFSLAGSAINNLKDGDVENYIFLLPPLPEQKKIASILTSVDEVIETTQKQIDKLQDLKKATMNELLTKGIGHTEFKDSELGRIPKSWEVVIGDEVLKLGGGVSPSAITFCSDGDVLFMKVEDFNNPQNYDRIKSTALSFQKDLNKKIKAYPQDTVVIAKRGAAILKNRVKLFSKVTSVDSNLMTIEMTRYHPKFFMYYLQWEDLSSLADTTSIPQLNNFHLYEHYFRMPPYKEQLQIVETVSAIDKKIETHRKKLSQTQSLKKSLMQDLLTGKVRVQVN